MKEQGSPIHTVSLLCRGARDPFLRDVEKENNRNIIKKRKRGRGQKNNVMRQRDNEGKGGGITVVRGDGRQVDEISDEKGRV